MRVTGREIRRVPPGWAHPAASRAATSPVRPQRRPHEDIDEELLGAADRLPAMPRWAPEEATCYQVYEDVTQGRPVSPVFDAVDGVRDWLVGQGDSRRAAERFCRHGRVPSLVLGDGTVYLDSESAALLPDQQQPP